MCLMEIKVSSMKRWENFGHVRMESRKIASGKLEKPEDDKEKLWDAAKDIKFREIKHSASLKSDNFWNDFHDPLSSQLEVFEK